LFVTVIEYLCLTDSEGQQSLGGRSNKSNPRRRWSTESLESLRATKVKMRRSYEAEASSTTVETKVQKTVEPSEWTIDDVVKHICDTDMALAQHAMLFRKHVSDMSVSRTYYYHITNHIFSIIEPL